MKYLINAHFWNIRRKMFSPSEEVLTHLVKEYIDIYKQNQSKETIDFGIDLAKYCLNNTKDASTAKTAKGLLGFLRVRGGYSNDAS